MLNIKILESIDETIFDKLFGHSIEAMDAGSYPWHLAPQVTTYADKRNYIFDAYQKILGEGIVWMVCDDDYPLILNAGYIEGSAIRWVLGLCGPDASNSRSYLYSQGFRDARDAFWRTVGVDSWLIETNGFENPIAAHARNRQNTGTFSASVDFEERDLKVVEALIIKVTEEP